MRTIGLFLLLALGGISLDTKAVTYMDKLPDTHNMHPNHPFFSQHGVIITKPTQSHIHNLLAPELKMDDISVFKECKRDCKDIKQYWTDYIENLKRVPLLVYSHLKDMSLDFIYEGIPFVPEKDVLLNIGNTTAIEVNGKMQFGGVIQVIALKDRNTLCSFAVDNIQHGLYVLSEDVVTTLVNGKLTEKISIYGKEKLGFMYNVVWYDDSYSYSLMCGYYEHSAYRRQAVLQLARRIDYDINH